MPQALRDVPQEAVDLIKAFEGIPDGDPSTVNIDAYLCPANVWTIGWGHAIMDGGVQLKGAAGKAKARALFPGGITREQAEALLRGDLIPRAAQLSRMLKVEVSDAQFGALMALLFNIGGANLAASTLLRKLNAGDANGASDQFLAWDKARVNGVLQALAGLTRRRRAERAMFLGQEWRTIAGVTRSRSRGVAVEVLPVPAMPAEDRAAMKKKPARKAAAKKAAAKTVGAKKVGVKKAPAPRVVKPRGRTTAPKAPSPRPTAKRPAPRTAR